MIAVGSGIGNSSQINGGQSAVPLRAKFHSHLVRMPCGCTDKLFGTRKLPFHRPAQIQGGKRAQILAQHLLFGAEAASDPFGVDVHFIRMQPEKISQLGFSQKRSLRTGPQMKPAILGQVRDRGMRFEMDMLLPVRFELAFVDNVSSRKSCFHVPVFAMDLTENVAARILDSRVHALLAVNERRSRSHRILRIENCRKNFIIDFNQTGPFFRGGFALRDHCRDSLADKPDHIVEHVAVVRIDIEIFMSRAGVKPARNIFPGIDAMHTL